MHQHAQRALEAVDDCLPRCRSHDDVGLLCQRPCRVGHVRGTGSPDMHLDGRLVVPVVADHVDALSRADFQAARARKGIAARGAQHQFLDAGIPLLAAGRPATMACQRHCNHTRQADGSASLHGTYNTADTVPPDCPHAPGASLPSLVIQGLLHEKNRPAHAYVRPPRQSSRGVDAGGATGGQPSAQFDLCIVCIHVCSPVTGSIRGPARGAVRPSEEATDLTACRADTCAVLLETDVGPGGVPGGNGWQGAAAARYRCHTLPLGCCQE